MSISKNVFLDTGNQNSGKLLSADLLSTLRSDILIGKFTHGQKLTENLICSSYDVSRTPVREALHRLEAEGLIETIPNRGAFVLGFSKQDICDIFELRKIFEVQAVKWATDRITDDELDALEETFEFMKFYTYKNDVEKMFNINMNFHQIIYKASHNKMLHNMLTCYQFYTKHAKHILRISDDYLTSLLEEHQEIFNALKNKDIPSSAKAAAKHMDKSIERYYNV